MGDLMSGSWPWYVAGPVIGLFVPALLLLGNRQFGISSTLRHMCAATVPSRAEYFNYDWRGKGLWNLAFLAGILTGGFLAGYLTGPLQAAISIDTQAALSGMGITDFTGLAPAQLFSWERLTTWPTLVALVGGGLLVGFGTAYAGGCTSGHAISGLAALEPASLVAVVGFFAGGLFCTYVILPLLFL
jgi:uncharacterized protein